MEAKEINLSFDGEDVDKSSPMESHPEENSVPHGWSKLDILTLQLALLICDAAPETLKVSEILKRLRVKRGQVDSRLRWLQVVRAIGYDESPHKHAGMPSTHLHYWTGEIERSQVVKRLQELGASIDTTASFTGIPTPGPDSLTVYVRGVRSDAARNLIAALLCFTEGDAVTVKEVSANTGSKPPTVSTWLLRLLEMGYLTRAQRPGHTACEYKYALSDKTSRREIEAIASEYQIPITPPLASRSPEGRIPDQPQRKEPVSALPQEPRRHARVSSRIGAAAVRAVKRVEAQHGPQGFEQWTEQIRDSKHGPLVLAPPRPPSVVVMLIDKLPMLDPSWDKDAIASWMEAYKILVTNIPKPALPDAPANDSLQAMADSMRLISNRQTIASQRIDELFEKLKIPEDLSNALRKLQQSSAEYEAKNRARQAD